MGAEVSLFLTSLCSWLDHLLSSVFSLYIIHLPPFKFLFSPFISFSSPSLPSNWFPFRASPLLCWQINELMSTLIFCPQKKNKRLESYIFLSKELMHEDFCPSAPNTVCLQTVFRLNSDGPLCPSQPPASCFHSSWTKLPRLAQIGLKLLHCSRSSSCKILPVFQHQVSMLDPQRKEITVSGSF